MRCTELFCGAGGASLGLYRAGYAVTGYDAWGVAVATHNANGITAHQHDLSDPAGDEVLEPCDLLWASPPCQPFSAAGDGAGEFDGRDGFPWTLRIIATLQPSVVIVENVKGLTFDKHGEYFGSVLSSLTALGYEWQWRVLNSADYGVPQTRERCFIIARNDGGRIVWPAPTHTDGDSLFLQPWVTMAEALGWSGFEAVKLMGDGMVERHGERPSRRDDEPAFSVRAQGGGRDPGGFVLRPTWTLDYRQTNRDGEPITCDVSDRPSPTIGTQSQSQWIIRAEDKWTLTRPATTIAGDTRVFPPGGHIANDGRDNANMVGRSENTIRLTIAELATLQGFPADWQWTGTKTDQARQAGNAVPPVMAQVLATANRPIVAVA
jgi:DNA (cytosine-5)-methyltransferase 1